jgi:mRNA-degrading endonuclease RelE of RelBE toxin-antitoxin system
MTTQFRVLASPRFERLYRKLAKRHPDLVDVYGSALSILQVDPHNVSRTYPIRKLEDATIQEGTHRLRLGRWRFVYTIAGEEVVLRYCGLRREDPYD